METAQKVLGEVRSVLLPMLQEVEGILKHVNGILFQESDFDRRPAFDTSRFG